MISTKLLKKVKSHHVLIIVILSFFLINNIIYLNKDNIEVWDEPRHLALALSYHDAFFYGEEMSGKERLDYGPLTYIAALLFEYILGRGKFALLMENILWLAVLLYSTFYVGKKLGSEPVGYFSVVILSFLPVMSGMTRIYLLDYPLVAMVTLAIAILLRTDFYDIKSSILYSIIFSLGLLVKLNFLFFLSIPTMVVILYHFRLRERLKIKLRMRCLLNIIIFGLSVLLLAMPWYVINGQGENSNIISRSEDVANVVSSENEFNNWIKGGNNFDDIYLHIIQLIGSQLNIFLFLFFILGISLLSYNMLSSWIMILWIIIPYIVICIFLPSMIHVDTRYLVPMIPAIVVISMVGIFKNGFKTKVKLIMLILVLFFTTYNFLYVSYDADYLGLYGLKGEVKPESVKDMIFFDDFNCWLSRPANDEDFQVDEMISFITDNSQEYSKVGVMVSNAVLLWENFRYHAKLQNTTLNVVDCVDDADCFKTDDVDVVIKTRKMFINHTGVYREDLMKRTSEFDALKEEYGLLGEFNLTTEDENHRCGYKMNEVVEIYKKIGEPR